MHLNHDIQVVLPERSNDQTLFDKLQQERTRTTFDCKINTPNRQSTNYKNAIIFNPAKKKKYTT